MRLIGVRSISVSILGSSKSNRNSVWLLSGNIEGALVGKSDGRGDGSGDGSSDARGGGDGDGRGDWSGEVFNCSIVAFKVLARDRHLVRVGEGVLSGGVFRAAGACVGTGFRRGGEAHGI